MGLSSEPITDARPWPSGAREPETSQRFPRGSRWGVASRLQACGDFHSGRIGQGVVFIGWGSGIAQYFTTEGKHYKRKDHTMAVQRKIYTPKERETKAKRYLALIATGQSKTDSASMLGVNQKLLAKWASALPSIPAIPADVAKGGRASVGKMGKRKTDDEKQILVAVYRKAREQGLSRPEAAKKAGAPAATLDAWATKQAKGIPTKRPGRKMGTKNKRPAGEIVLTTNAGGDLLVCCGKVRVSGLDAESLPVIVKALQRL